MGAFCEWWTGLSAVMAAPRKRRCRMAAILGVRVKTQQTVGHKPGDPRRLVTQFLCDGRAVRADARYIETAFETPAFQFERKRRSRYGVAVRKRGLDHGARL